MGAGQGARRRTAGGPDPGAFAHLLPRKARCAARLGLRLRRLPGVRVAGQRLGGLDGAGAAGAVFEFPGAMTYAVKEIFLTLQGEGGQAGRAAVFCRFAGCNLWSGREEDRADAVCSFCDTDFVGTDGTNGGRYPDAEMLADAVAALWPAGEADQFVVCTGGEPLLQLDPPLIEALHGRGFEIAIETNGTIIPPA